MRRSPLDYLKIGIRKPAKFILSAIVLCCGANQANALFAPGTVPPLPAGCTFAAESATTPEAGKLLMWCEVNKVSDTEMATRFKALADGATASDVNCMYYILSVLL